MTDDSQNGRRRGRPITDTQARVARLVALGRTNREVGGELHISPKTVEWHLSQIYRALGVRSRTELAIWMAREIPWVRREK